MGYYKRVFSLTPANAADSAALLWILQNKTFYPEATSTPALPASYDGAFDYRQLFKFIGFRDGIPLVYTRKEYTTVEFGVNVVPTADWAARYKMSAPPTVTAITDYTDLTANGANTNTGIDTFLSYDYQLYNNK